MAVDIEGESELKRFTKLLDGLGVTYAMNYHPTRKDWEWELKEAGFDVDTRACLVVKLGLGGTEYIFGTLGTARDTQYNLLLYGPKEVFLMSRVTHTGIYAPRECPDAFGHRMFHGFDALKISYPDETWTC